MAVRSFSPPCLRIPRRASLAVRFMGAFLALSPRLAMGPLLAMALCSVGNAATQTPATSADEQQARVAELIEQLGDENYHRRNAAQWELERIGLAAFEKLRQAAQTHPDAQVARAARYLIDSQNVVWWLESDGLQVRELLKTYNDSKSEQRDATLQSLSDIGSPDAILALCRLTRFESSELRSKSAALFLMQAIAQKFKRPDTRPSAQQVAQLRGSIALTLGDSQRAAATWLRALMSELDSGAAQTPSSVPDSDVPDSDVPVSDIPDSDIPDSDIPDSDIPDSDVPVSDVPVSDVPTSDVETSDNIELGADGAEQLERRDPAGVAVWRQIVERELALAEHAGQSTTADTLAQAAASPTELQITLRLYRWIGTWVTERYGRQSALDLVRTSLSLVGQDPQALITSAAWAN